LKEREYIILVTVKDMKVIGKKIKEKEKELNIMPMVKKKLEIILIINQ